MIIVKPLAGLCNRMRVIDACISVHLNNPTKPAIKMLWEKDGGLNCAFEDLFKPIEFIQIQHLIPELNYFLFYKNTSKASLKVFLKKNLYKLLYKNYQYYDDLSIQTIAYKPEFWNTTSKNFVLHTCVDFYTDEFLHASYFKPVDLLQKRIDYEVSKFSVTTTGIHIRRSDSVKAIKTSQTNLFINKMEEMLKIDANQQFYLATDDKKEEELLIKLFGKKIIRQENKDLSRSSQKGIEDALVDLYALGKTNSILGSYSSSFSKTAAAFNKIPLIIIS